MQFLTDYFRAIDALAIGAVVVLVAAAFIRKESIWMGLLVLVVALWAASRLFGLF
jgi:hypothetical protein